MMTPWMKPIEDASVWSGKDLERDQSWRFSLTPQQVAELDDGLRQVKNRGLSFAEILRVDFPLPTLTETLQGVLHQLRSGRGFAVLSGFPTEYEIDDLDRLYWGLCTHLGTGVTQNNEAGLIHYITDGALRPQAGARQLGKPRPVKLHVDLSDCVALFCLRQAPDDPQSLVSSSMAVYNEILRQHPEYLPRLYEGFIWSRIDTYADETPYSNFKVPAFSATDGVVTCRFHPGWIRGGMKKAGLELTDEETEIFDFIADTAAANSYAFCLQKGDSPSVTTTRYSMAGTVTMRSKRKRTSGCCCASGWLCPMSVPSPTKAASAMAPSGMARWDGRQPTCSQTTISCRIAVARTAYRRCSDGIPRC